MRRALADRPREASPSLTLSGILKHLAWVEDYWFAVILTGSEPHAAWAEADWDADGDWEFTSATQHTPADLIDLFAAIRAASDQQLDAALTRGGLEALSTRGRHGELVSTRWIITHMIEEYARHCGHADLIREAIDGQTGYQGV